MIVDVRNFKFTLVGMPAFLAAVILIFVCTSRVCAQNKLPVGFELQANGRIVAPDSLLPEYYLNYSLGGQFRKGIFIEPDAYQSINKLLPIPILVGANISTEKSIEMFSRAVKFHTTGIDPQGTDGNGTGKGNIDMPAWVNEYITDEINIERLYKDQLFCGNVIIVDSDVKIPMLIANNYASKEEELPLYYNCLYGWAAAYPWYFYELPNIALREALSKRDLSVVELFAKYRFTLTNALFEEMLSMHIIPNISK